MLTQSRERVSEELARLQKDNDSLQGKHSLHASLQQAENFILPDTIEVTRPPPCRHGLVRLKRLLLLSACAFLLVLKALLPSPLDTPREARTHNPRSRATRSAD